MTQYTFPPLPLAGWRPTRDTLQAYTQLLGKIRGALSPAQKHWWHVSLQATAVGLTTTPIPAGDRTFELLLDLTRHQLAIRTSWGETAVVPLVGQLGIGQSGIGQSAAAVCDATLEILQAWGIEPAIDRAKFAAATAGGYEETAVTTYWQTLAQIDAILKEFKAGFRGETSPVQLWPHHFDLAMVWLTGRLVPGQDPDNADYADEQMNFGFSTGDDTTPEPYFYATAYPRPDGLTDAPLPPGAYWHTTGWTGALLPYAALVGAENPSQRLLGFWRAAHQAGAALMK